MANGRSLWLLGIFGMVGEMFQPWYHIYTSLWVLITVLIYSEITLLVSLHFLRRNKFDANTVWADEEAQLILISLFHFTFVFDLKIRPICITLWYLRCSVPVPGRLAKLLSHTRRCHKQPSRQWQHHLARVLHMPCFPVICPTKMSRRPGSLHLFVCRWHHT